MTARSTCKLCGGLMLRRSTGRPPKYCGPQCRKAAADERARLRPRGQRVGSPKRHVVTAVEHERQARNAELLHDRLADLRDAVRLTARCLNQDSSALALLPQLARALKDLELVQAAMASRASYQGASWEQIGEALNKTAETARKNYAADKVARRLGALSPQRQGKKSSDKGGPPDGDVGELTVITARVSAAVHNRLAGVLSTRVRSSGLPQQVIAERVGCSASFLSRVLGGDRLPSWPLTERLALVLDADVHDLRALWESERLRDRSTRPTLLPGHSTATPALDTLRTAMELLHIRTGASRLRPDSTPDWRLIEARFADFMTTEALPSWDDTKFLTNALTGDPDRFEGLWLAAQRGAEPSQSAEAPPPQSRRPAAQRPSPIRPGDPGEAQYFVQTHRRQALAACDAPLR